MNTALGSFRVVAILEVKCCHAIQPGLTELGRVLIGLGQTVVQVDKLLMVILVNLIAKIILILVRTLSFIPRYK